jgi:hypothetical protein
VTSGNIVHGIPEGYVLLSPLPLPRIVVHVDPESVQPQLLKVLRQVGYQSDDKPFADLSSPERTMVKVFHYMLTRAVDRGPLPWGQAGHYEADLDSESRLSALIEANSEARVPVARQQVRLVDRRRDIGEL